MIVSVDMATHLVVLAEVLLALRRIGHLEVMPVGLVITVGMAMIVIMEVVLEVLVVVAVVVFLVIVENHHLAILVGLVPIQEGLVGDMVAVV